MQCSRSGSLNALDVTFWDAFWGGFRDNLWGSFRDDLWDHLWDGFRDAHRSGGGRAHASPALADLVVVAGR
jgi:hypothetical protein